MDPPESTLTLIPFLKPTLPGSSSIGPYLRQMDESRVYSNFGPLVQTLESRVLEGLFDGKGAITTVHNATLGLMLSIDALKRPTGKYALMPSFTFAATPLAAMWAGLTPYFVDIDEDTWLLSAEGLEDAISMLGNEIAIVVPYATFGSCLTLSAYEQLHDDGLPVVVDAAPALGSLDGGRQYGAGFPGAVVFSLHATKPMGIGEGGLVYSSTDATVKRVRNASNFGFENSRASTVRGLNAKLPEISAAVALAVLDSYEKQLSKRREVISAYDEELQGRGKFDAGWTRQSELGSVAHQFLPLLAPTREHKHESLATFADRQIGSRSYFDPPCHIQPLFSHFTRANLPVTEDISARILSLPLFDDMSRQEVVQVVDALEG